MNFRNKFSLQRPHPPSRPPKDADSLKALERALESDRGRIINSAAIRRLQQKTQVFPLERNAAVRSRLTHSLEVQQTGRFIVRTIFDKLGPETERYGLDGLERLLESQVEMACLMHDIGNPPFGHFGEAAFIRWFEQHIDQLGAFRSTSDSQLKSDLIRDLCQFEGNAQAIRLVHHLLNLNLTYLQTAGILKYTRPATTAKPQASEPLSYLQKKPGYYLSEQDFIRELGQTLNMSEGHRHPSSYLMEAADDISYCLADLEDGVEKGLLSYTRLAELLIQTFDDDSNLAEQTFLGSHGERSFRQVVEYALKRANEEAVNKEHEFFVWLRVNLIHPLVNHAADSFIDNIEAVYHGKLNRALLEDESLNHRIIDTFKRVAIKHIFSVSEVETLELQGYQIITGLLNYYRPLLELDADTFQAVLAQGARGYLVESRLAKRLPRKHVRAYHNALQRLTTEAVDFALWESYYRCRLLLDMVSGMTDQFALEEYQTLSVK
nr:dGTPase [Saliniradius amylolyticus]